MQQIARQRAAHILVPATPAPLPPPPWLPLSSCRHTANPSSLHTMHPCHPRHRSHTGRVGIDDLLALLELCRTRARHYQSFELEAQLQVPPEVAGVVRL